MDEAEVWSTLARGGAAPPQADAEPLPRLSKYNGLLDPPGAEALASALAKRLHGRGASLVVVWEDPEDVVLGFVVARHLGVPVLRTFNADGLVGHTGRVPDAARAVFITDCARDPVTPRAIRALLERSGGSLIGIAALVDAELTEEPLLASLTTPRAGVAEIDR